MKLALRTLGAAFVFVTAACSSSNEDVASSGERVTVCGQTTVKGIDVYHGDNGGSAIDWSKVKAAGISFAFAKATESTNFTDPAFTTNWSGMKSAGLVRGAYHFFHADVDPTQQATYFLNAVGKLTQGDLLVLDLETTNNQTQSTILSNAETFMAAVKSKSGVTPILYTSPAFLSSFGTLGQYPLWVANYSVTCPTVPSAWKTYDFWQSTGSGSLSAVTGAVDLDTFNGTLSDLTTFAASTWPQQTDSGAPPDAGTETDAAPPEQDASAPPPSNDAGSSYDASHHADDGGGSGDFPTSSGCDAAPTGPRDASWLAVFAALALAARRRRLGAMLIPSKRSE